MQVSEKKQITVKATINTSLEKTWKHWTIPEHITQWCYASPEWHAPKAENDLRTGGRFSTRMEAKDGSFGFDFSGVYTEIKDQQLIAYTLEDNRKVRISFNGSANTTTITETFEAETENTLELQQAGWQAILNNFKKYVEEN